MGRIVDFDDSFSAALAQTEELLGALALDAVTVHRDATGHLSILYNGELTDSHIEQLTLRLQESLGAYARSDRLVADRNAPGVSKLLSENVALWIPYKERRIRYIDRRIVGLDWLTAPETTAIAPSPPRFVFASLKGGVGRTTAICVAAADLASAGKNILVLDLDLEAPGAGAVLLTRDASPQFGVIDYLLESVIAGPEYANTLLKDLVAPSPFMKSDGGRIDVVPALGKSTRPENYLGKLARAVLDIGPDGVTYPIRAKLQALITQLVKSQSYDAVLIDARAGLAELAAGPLLSLGATVFLFGTAQQQTIDDFRLLLAHLSTLVRPDTSSPWQNLAVVLAKTTGDADRNRWFLEELYGLFQDYIYEEQEGFDGFNFAESDSTAPHYPIPIEMNLAFSNWDPARRADDLTKAFYERSFRPFLDELSRRLEEAV